MITAETLGLVDDKDLADRVIAYGRTLAPCLQTLEGQDLTDTVAVLKNVAKVAAGRLPGLKARAVGDWSWTYLTDAEMGSMIGPDDRAVLSRVCNLKPVGGPRGSFPAPPREYLRLWPS